MSKGLGQKIAIKFTEVLSGDVTGWVPEPVTYGDYFRPIGTATGSSQYSSYAPSRAFDGSTSSYWYTTTAGDQWIQIELAEPTWVYGFRWYVGSSYRPNGFNFQGSNDGENWEVILSDNSSNATGWHEFLAYSPKQYKYYRWTVTSRYLSYLRIYEIELLGVAGNEGAFTITGKEYQYVNGPIIDKEYRVVKVERYGIVPIWRLGDSVALDTLGEVEIIDTNAIQIASDTSASLSVSAEAGDIVLATVSLRSSSTVPTGWTEIYRSEVGGSNQYLVLATKEVMSDGLVTYTATQSSPGRIMINLITIRNAKVKHAPEFTVVGNFTGEVSVPNKQVGEKLIWCMSANIWFGTGYYSWKTSPDDLQLVDFVSEDPPPRQANFIDLGEGEATGRKFIPSVTGETSVFISAVKLLEEVDSYKVVEISPIKITGQYRVRWQEDKPTGTDITIEYTTGTVQGEWLEASNGEVITSDTNMWFRITLETTDTSVTPTLQDLWLEEPEAPNDQIRLVMHPQGRFNNAVGPLTVQYDHTKGSLRGRGGPVDSFTETFIPTDLEPKPNPHVAENIEVSAEATVSFTKVTYNQRYADEQIVVSATVTLDFIYVGIINP
jgi:hypothetical protein